ncbi:MAG: glycosyltransferase family 4 protein [Nitrospirae bacterium YQR-1]
MRLAIDATVLEDRHPTGIGNVALNVVNKLSELHDDIVIWSVEESLLKIDKSKLRFPFSEKGRRILGKNIYLARALWTQLSLPSLLRKEQADIFFSPIAEGIIKPPIPQVVTIYDITPILFKEHVPLLRNLSFRYRLPQVFKYAKKIITDSYAVREDIINYYGLRPETVEVVYVAYDTGHFKRTTDEATAGVLNKYGLVRGEYFIYVGSIVATKNLDTLLRAFYKSGLDKTLVLAGKIAEAGYYKKLLFIKETLKLTNVKFVDYVPYEDLPALYSGAAALTFVSLIEGFGMPVVEAMSCGLAVISSDRGSLPEVCGGAAIVTDALSEDEISRAMIELAQNTAKREELIKRGYERIKEFSWQKTAGRILEICKEAAFY